MDSDARYRFALWVIIVLILLNLGSLGFLWYGYLHRPQPPQRDGRKVDPEEFFVRDVGLDEEQARTFHVLREEHFRKTESLRLEIRRLNRQLMEALFDPSPDSAKVQAISAAIGDKHAEFERDVFVHFQRVKQICRSDQQGRLKRLVLEALDRPKGPAQPGDQDRNRRRGPDDRQPPSADDYRPPPGDHNRPRLPDTGGPGK